MRQILMMCLGLLLTFSEPVDGQVRFEIHAHHSIKNGDLGELELDRGGVAGIGNLLVGIAVPVKENGNINAILLAGYNDYGNGSSSLFTGDPILDVDGIAEDADEIIEGAGDIIEGVGEFIEGVVSGIDREYGRRGIPILGGARIYNDARSYYFQAVGGIEVKRSETKIVLVNETDSEVDIIGSVSAGAFFWRGLGATVSYNVSQGSWRYLNMGLVYQFGR